jgi:acetoin utilization deacetylase AcuC-like enzyme
MPIPVYFSPLMVADAKSYSPSAGKPAAVLLSWRNRGFPLEVLEPAPVTREDLALAHDPAMVEGILEGRRNNGFDNRSRPVAASLPYTTGALYAAAVRALHDGRVAVAPVSGFHHARWNRPNAFCSFNGLVVTALLLRDRHSVGRVGILDFDQHEGDGTDDIIDRLGLDFIDHHTAGAFHYSAAQAEEFLAGIPAILEGMRDRGCELVLYQAGADPHVNDPLGGFLTTEQLARRDRRVFESCARLRLPVAWVLAGGYQSDGKGIRPVLNIHDNTMGACVAVYASGESFGRHPDELDASEIADRLWQGACPPKGAVLEQKGFTMAVFCAAELQPLTDDYRGVRLVCAPNDDDFDLTDARLAAAVDAARRVVEELRLGGRVLVSCAAGLNRSGLVTALALAALEPATPMADHIARVQARRPGALGNPHFVERLGTHALTATRTGTRSPAA